MLATRAGACENLPVAAKRDTVSSTSRPSIPLRAAKYTAFVAPTLCEAALVTQTHAWEASAARLTGRMMSLMGLLTSCQQVALGDMLATHEAAHEVYIVTTQCPTFLKQEANWPPHKALGQ
jgi:hypothetical protein